MPGGRPAKPTALKLLQGNPGKRPIKKNEPKPKQASRVPAPPQELGQKAKAEWRRVAKELHASGVLTLVDTKILANYCQAYDDMLTARGLLHVHNTNNPDSINLHKKMTGDTKTHPYVDQIRQHRADMLRWATELGITPASRTKVASAKPDETNEFDRF